MRGLDRFQVTDTKDAVARSAQAKKSRDKVRTERERLRRQGLRPIQIWVPDVNSPEFAAEARRQSLAVANSPHAKEEQEFVDAASDWEGMPDWKGS